MRQVALLYLMVWLCGCQTTQSAPKAQMPLTAVWNGRIYLGDPTRHGVARSPLEQPVDCSSAEFSRMVCLSVEDYTALMQYFIQSACVNQ